MPLLIGVLLIVLGIGAFFVLPPLWGILAVVIGGVLIFVSGSGGG